MALLVGQVNMSMGKEGLHMLLLEDFFFFFDWQMEKEVYVCQLK